MGNVLKHFSCGPGSATLVLFFYEDMKVQGRLFDLIIYIILNNFTEKGRLPILNY
jgi:hypothetical protein